VTDKELELIRKAAEDLKRKIKTPLQARKLLIKEGIYDKDGCLSENYR
jgi:hypothetical protein